MLISHKIDFKANIYLKDKEHYIKRSIYQKEIAIINTYEYDQTATKYTTQKQQNWKEKNQFNSYSQRFQ